MSARSYNEQGTARRPGRNEYGQFDGTTIRPNAQKQIAKLKYAIELRERMLTGNLTERTAEHFRADIKAYRAELDKLTEQDERRAA